MTGLFQKVKSFFIESAPVDVYGGNKGGYSYLIFCDPKSKEILQQYIAPPKQQSKNIGVGAGTGPGLSGNVNYQSEETFGETFLITNKNASLQVDPENLRTKFNETQGTKLPQPDATYRLAGDTTFLAGAYMVPVSPKDVENPNFEAHFPCPDPRVDDLLVMFPEFVVNAFWPDDRIFRSSIFLHDAVKKELKMHAAYNMTGAVDYMLALPDHAGTIGVACEEKTPIIWDGAVIKHEDRAVDSSKVWDKMKSILAVPILDENNIPLGALSIDTNKGYADAHFADANLNNALMILSRSIGRLLERIVR